MDCWHGFTGMVLKALTVFQRKRLSGRAISKHHEAVGQIDLTCPMVGVVDIFQAGMATTNIGHEMAKS